MTHRKGTYKVKTVCRQVTAVNVMAKTPRMKLWDVLDCGHAIQYKEPESTAEAIRIIFAHAEGRPRRRRCFACVSGHVGYFQAIDWDSVKEQEPQP